VSYCSGHYRSVPINEFGAWAWVRFPCPEQCPQFLWNNWYNQLRARLGLI
jgi:hypothetical protein